MNSNNPNIKNQINKLHENNVINVGNVDNIENIDNTDTSNNIKNFISINKNIQQNVNDNKNKINHIVFNEHKNKKSKKNKNKRSMHEQMKEEYNNYIELKNNNKICPMTSIDNLMIMDITNDNNKVKVNEMKDTIRKNSSYNLVGDIILEINQINSTIDLIGHVKKIKSSSSLNNINKYTAGSPTKYIQNDTNMFTYLIGEDCVDLEQDTEPTNNDVKINQNNQNNQNNQTKIPNLNTKNKKLITNFNEIADLNEKINSVGEYHLIHTPFKVIGEEILNEEIACKYKSKLKSNPENEHIIRKLKETFKKLVYKELKDKPNMSQILLDNDLDDVLKVKILRKYIKFTTEDEVFSDESEKIKIEIKNLLKQKKLRISDDYEELCIQVENKIMPPDLKMKLEDIYYRVISGDQPKLHNLLNNLLKLPYEKKQNILDSMSSSLVPKDEKIKFIKKLYMKLDADLYGMEETKDSIISWICQKINNPSRNSSKYLCLCGPAGVGKTSIVHSIAESLEIPYSYISLANVDEPGSLIGHGYTYEGSQCGSIANGLISNNCTNGILLFDELDKTKEKVQNTLLGIFDPLQNTKFRDAYFGEFNLNLSECMMIVCLNDISNVNPILKDRLHIVNITGYCTKDKKIIVSKYIIPKLNSQYNLKKIQIEDQVIDEIIERTKNFEGIRQIQMYITKIYELLVLDEYTNKYNFEGIFRMNNINLLKLVENNISHLSLYI